MLYGFEPSGTSICYFYHEAYLRVLYKEWTDFWGEYTGCKVVFFIFCLAGTGQAALTYIGCGYKYWRKRLWCSGDQLLPYEGTTGKPVTHHYTWID